MFKSCAGHSANAAGQFRCVHGLPDPVKGHSANAAGQFPGRTKGFRINPQLSLSGISDLLESGRIRRCVQKALKFVVELEQGDREAGHIEGCHKVAHLGLCDPDLLLIEDLFYAQVGNEQLAQRGCSHSIDHDGDFVALTIDALVEDLAHQSIYRSRRTADLFAVRARGQCREKQTYPWT